MKNRSRSWCGFLKNLLLQSAVALSLFWAIAGTQVSFATDKLHGLLQKELVSVDAHDLIWSGSAATVTAASQICEVRAALEGIEYSLPSLEQHQLMVTRGSQPYAVISKTQEFLILEKNEPIEALLPIEWWDHISRTDSNCTSMLWTTEGFSVIHRTAKAAQTTIERADSLSSFLMELRDLRMLGVRGVLEESPALQRALRLGFNSTGFSYVSPAVNSYADFLSTVREEETPAQVAYSSNVLLLDQLQAALGYTVSNSHLPAATPVYCMKVRERKRRFDSMYSSPNASPGGTPQTTPDRLVLGGTPDGSPVAVVARSQTRSAPITIRKKLNSPKDFD